MIERPNITDQEILSRFDEEYGIRASRLEFLPVGNDATAWVFRARCHDAPTYLLKVKKGGLVPAVLRVPRYLHDQGFSEVVAPIPNKEGELFAHLGEFALLVYPFIEGEPGMNSGLSDDQWIEYGRLVKKIHAARLPADLLEILPRETFTPKWYEMVLRLDALVQSRQFVDSYQKELARFWLARREEIRKITGRAGELGRLCRDRGLDGVLCHADIHTANLLVDRLGQLHVVDWDEVIFAPKERDLMFVLGDTYQEDLFFRGYGATTVDRLALAYYCFEWVVQEIGDYGKRVFLMDELGEKTRQESLEGFLQLFQPGDVVDGAYRSDPDRTQG